MAFERLQKILSGANVCSRRQAERLIREGRVSLNGETVQELGVKADLELDRIEVDGELIKVKEKHLYYKYYKARGLISSKSDELGRKTLFDDLELPQSVNCAGRLDKESEGLMILTNDGEFLKHLTHPRYDLTKTYHVKVFPKAKASLFAQLEKGLQLEDGWMKAFKARPLLEKDESWIEVVLKEGKKREIRKMLEHCSYHVKRLIRVAHGSLCVDNLKAGELQEISEEDLLILRTQVGLSK